MATKKKPTKKNQTQLEANFHQRFEQARAAKGLTVEDVAAQAGVSKVTIYRVCNGPSQSKVETIDKIAAVLGVPTTYFWGEAPAGATA